jgi:hypothetical protein
MMAIDPTTSVPTADQRESLEADTPPFGLSDYQPDQVERVRYEIQSEQNLVLGAAAGIAAGLVGALIWAAVTVATGYQIGWLAIGIGFLVGAAVRWAGRGTTQTFGVVGGVLSLLSVLAGNFLSLLGLLAGMLGLSYAEVVTQFDYSNTLTWLIDSFSPIDLLFYGIAIWQGYQVSIREVTTEEIRERLASQGVVPQPGRSDGLR